MINGERLPGDQGRIAINDVCDECSYPNGGRLGCQCSKKGPGFKPITSKMVGVNEVIHDPRAVETELLELTPCRTISGQGDS